YWRLGPLRLGVHPRGGQRRFLDRRHRAALFGAVMKRLLLLYLFWCFGTGCATTPPPKPAPQAVFTCLDACRRVQELGCPQGWPTNRGATCADVCENMQSSGIVVWDLACMTQATSCLATTDCQHPVQ